MSYVIKRKLQSAISGGDSGVGTSTASLSTLIQHIQTSTAGLTVTTPSLLDTLTVNHLIVRRTLKIPARTDGYK